MTAPEQTTVAFTPIKSEQRIEALDVLRGLAIFGILFVNAVYFGLPMMEAVQPALTGTVGVNGQDADWNATWFIKTFFEFKFVSMFSMMFGIGAALQFDRARRSGSGFDGFYCRRLLILLGFGVLHAVAFFYGDILTIYAVLGLSLLAFCRLKTKILLPIVIGLMMIAALMSTGMVLLESMAPQMEATSAADQATRTGWDAIQASGFQPQNPIWIDAETVAHQDGPYRDLLLFRVLSWAMGLISIILSYGWHILAMFALGVVIKRSAFFTPSDSGRRIRFWMMVFLPVALVVEGLTAWSYLSQTSPIWAPAILSLVREFSTVATMLGYAAVLVTLVQMGIATRLFGSLAKVGRMALTNYLLESLLMTTLFEFYGFGLFDQISRSGLILVSTGICIILMIFSVLWLKGFSRGPMEWLWRTLAYLKAPSLKRG